MKILGLLKNKTFKSGIQGQNQARLRATKNKSPEERARVRACVLTKVFFQSLPAHEGKQLPEPEIIWQGIGSSLGKFRCSFIWKSVIRRVVIAISLTAEQPHGVVH